MFIKKIKTISLLIVLLFVSVLILTGCKDNNDDPGTNPGGFDNNVVTQVRNYNILEGTEHQTAVYVFTSNVEGPKVAIVGGIHGDEVAGWKTALLLIEKVDYYHGTVMIIPQAYIKADNMINRYPGYTASNGAKYNRALDLNRNFPGKANGTETEQIAYAISQEVENFDADYIIDLHESRRSVTDPNPLLGDLLIYGNIKSSIFCEEITYEFNKNYKLPGEVSFGTDQDAPGGAFNQYFGEKFPKKVVFTVETNRQLTEARRIEQQSQLLSIFFETIWSE